MSLETSYDVQEMLRDDGVQTFRAKEKGTGRVLELHLFPPFGRPENKVLFERMKSLPLETKRKFLDIGVDGSTPFLVTDPLPAGRTFRVWADELIAGVQKASTAITAPITPLPMGTEETVQILQAGQWRTGTPIPDSLVWKPAPPPPPPPSAFPVIPSDDSTVVMKVPFGDTAPVANLAEASTAEFHVGDFTAMFQAAQLKAEVKPEVPELKTAPVVPAPVEATPSVGEFTAIFQTQKPSADLEAFQQAPQVVAPPPPAVTAEPEMGEFTRMFQTPAAFAPAGFTPAPTPIAPPPAPAPATPQHPFFSQPEPAEGGEFTKFFENPLKPAPMSSQPAASPFEMPPPPPPAARRSGEFTDVFGTPQVPAAGAFSEKPQAPFAAPPASPASFSATGLSAPVSWSQPQAQPSFGAGPSEYTRMMSAPAVPTLGQPGYGQAPGSAPAAAPAPKKSNLPIFIGIGIAVVLVIVIVVILIMHGMNPAPAATTPAAK